MKFSDIAGHEETKARLREMADNDRIPHALLLEGPSEPQVYARTGFRAVYTLREPPRRRQLRSVPACVQHQNFCHIDTVYSFPVVKKSGRTALSDDYRDQFREFITESPYMDFDQWVTKLDNVNAQPQIYVEEGAELLRRLTYMTRRSKFKVVLMWLPERLKEETANKLLKLVEEPYADTKFIMVSNNPRQILPTIYSRTQRIAVRRYSDEELEQVLTGQGMDARKLPIWHG